MNYRVQEGHVSTPGGSGSDQLLHWRFYSRAVFVETALCIRRKPLNRNEKEILTVTCFGHFMSHFNMLVFPALILPLSRMYGMGLSQVLALSLWMYLLFGLAALPWGLLVDKLGAKPLLFTFYAGSGICGLAAAHFLRSPTELALCLAGLGLFSAIYHPAGLGLISRSIARMSVALGYNGMAGNAGLALAPILTGLINYRFGSQAAYVFLGALNLLGAVIMLLVPLQEPLEKPSTQSEAPARLALGFAMLCVCITLGGLAYCGVTVILPSYFELRSSALIAFLNNLSWLVHSKNVAATGLTSLVFVVGIVGAYFGGRASERFDPRRVYLLSHLLALPMALAMAFAMNLPLVLVTMAYLLFLMGMQPAENTLLAWLTPAKLRHSGFGVKFILTFGVGSLAVRMVGWIKQAWSLPAVFIAMTLISGLIVTSILVLFRVTRDLPAPGKGQVEQTRRIILKPAEESTGV